MLSARIIILNYCGERLLPLCLPSIVQAAELSSHDVKVAVLNNPSDRDGLEYVKTTFGNRVEIYQASQNKVLCSYNEYVPLVKEDVVILLNNDIRVAPDFTDPLIKKFEENPLCFLAAPLVLNFDGTSVDAGPTQGRLRYGMFWTSALYNIHDPIIKRPRMTFSSGFGAFSRKYFLELGGYDERYLPGIFEDVDLCFRARSRGYHLFYEPASIIYHMGQESFKSAFGREKIDILASRNNFLFLWKNYRGLYFQITHAVFVCLRFLVQWIQGKDALWQGWLLARQVSRHVS